MAHTNASESVRADFQGKHGDRRQELVFIGVDMDKETMIEKLDACILSDAEMEAYESRRGSVV